MMQKDTLIRNCRQKTSKPIYSYTKVEKVSFDAESFMQCSSDESDGSSEVTKQEREWGRETKETTQNRSKALP